VHNGRFFFSSDLNALTYWYENQTYSTRMVSIEVEGQPSPEDGFIMSVSRKRKSRKLPASIKGRRRIDSASQKRTCLSKMSERVTMKNWASFLCSYSKWQPRNRYNHPARISIRSGRLLRAHRAARSV